MKPESPEAFGTRPKRSPFTCPQPRPQGQTLSSAQEEAKGRGRVWSVPRPAGPTPRWDRQRFLEVPSTDTPGERAAAWSEAPHTPPSAPALTRTGRVAFPGQAEACLGCGEGSRLTQAFRAERPSRRHTPSVMTKQESLALLPRKATSHTRETRGASPAGTTLPPPPRRGCRQHAGQPCASQGHSEPRFPHLVQRAVRPDFIAKSHLPGVSKGRHNYYLNAQERSQKPL